MLLIIALFFVLSDTSFTTKSVGVLPSPADYEALRLDPQQLADYFLSERNDRDKEIREIYRGSSRSTSCFYLETHLKMLRDMKAAQIEKSVFVIFLHDSTKKPFMQYLSDDDMKSLEKAQRSAEADLDLKRFQCSQHSF